MQYTLLPLYEWKKNLFYQNDLKFVVIMQLYNFKIILFFNCNRSHFITNSGLIINHNSNLLRTAKEFSAYYSASGVKSIIQTEDMINFFGVSLWKHINIESENCVRITFWSKKSWLPHYKQPSKSILDMKPAKMKFLFIIWLLWLNFMGQLRIIF